MTRIGFALCVLVTALSGPAIAGAGWDAFVARCLLPIENVEKPDLDGLEAVSGNGWSLPDGAGVLAVEGMIETEFARCVVDTNISEQAAHANWLSAVLEDESYIPIEGDDGVESNGWREPRIEVFASEINGGIRFEVREIDLEA